MALLAMGVTCGGDGGSFSSGLDQGTQLGTLSPSDADKLCQSLNDWTTNHFAAEIKELSCRGAGIAAAAFGGSSPTQQQAACSSAYDQCMKQPAQQSPVAGSCRKPSASCKATVGELESCINELSPLLRQVVSSFPTCQQLASGGGSAPPSDLKAPASCKTLESKCPDVDLPNLPN
jgi:hypothetical protein